VDGSGRPGRQRVLRPRPGLTRSLPACSPGGESVQDCGVRIAGSTCGCCDGRSGDLAWKPSPTAGPAVAASTGHQRHHRGRGVVRRSPRRHGHRRLGRQGAASRYAGRTPRRTAISQRVHDLPAPGCARWRRNRCVAAERLCRRAMGTDAAGRGESVTAIAGGERWPGGELRPAVEDMWGAGTFLRALGLGEASPEASAAVGAFSAVQDLAVALRGCAGPRVGCPRLR